MAGVVSRGEPCGVIFGNAGGLGAAGPKALDLEGRKWERFFEGDYTKAKQIMSRLDANEIPDRMALPPDVPTMHVVVEVMHRWIPQARKVVAGLQSSATGRASGRGTAYDERNLIPQVGCQDPDAGCAPSTMLAVNL